jgi:hypothetical protein
VNILLFGTDGDKLKAAAIHLRAEGHVAHLRNPIRFDPNEVEPSYDVVMLLEPSDSVRSAYEAYNSRQDCEKQIVVEERLDFNPPTARELDVMAGKPHWPDMTTKELIEYARDNFDKKVLGRTKAEIMQAVDLLWSAANSKPLANESSLSIPIGDK